jgi:hypothetical protein
MVWKDVTFGFTVAGVIAAFVPPAFFQWLFVGSGSGDGAAWWQIALHTLIGPLAAFFTFIGSMGNIPLAAVLFGSGVSFAGIMAFIFSDLVVFPVLRISARYFGWRMALYIVGVFLVSLVVSALVLHGAFAALDLLPERAAATTDQLQPTERFSVDYTLFLNIAFLLLSFVFAGFLFFGQQGGRGDSEGQPSADGEGDHSGQQRESDDGGDEGDGGSDWLQRLLLVLAIGSILWLALGVLLWLTPLGA